MKQKDAQFIGFAALIVGIIVLLISASPILIPLIGIIIGLALVMIGLHVLGYPTLNVLINSFLNQFYRLFDNKHKK